MDLKLIFICFGVTLLLYCAQASSNHRLVVYWGQNAVYNMKKEKQYWEKPLTHFCEKSSYDVVVLAFMHVFFDRRQKDSLPGLNFAFHCETSMNSDLPFLLRCPQIEAGIEVCQKRGIKVLMSLGGATGGYGFQSDAEAKTFAHTVWNLLFAGTKMNNIRPFGKAILDGVDLDIEGGSSVGYTAFVRELRGLMKTDSSKQYTIAAAPQCPFPDHFLGPGSNTAFGDAPEIFDEIYIQFYNNYCHTGDRKEFDKNIRQWLNYSKNKNGPKIFIGMPSHDRAAFGRGYWRTPSEVAKIYNDYRNEPRFGGFMLWDASFDQNNVINGKRYSEHIVALFGSPPRPTAAPGTPGTPGPGPVTTNKPATTKPKGSGGIESCTGKSDGIYAHAKNCEMYIQCHNGVTHKKTCPPGLKFNKDRKYCDWATNVTC